MAKQDVLDAINATIVENGQKGITAQSLNNILTMMTENAGEGGGSGDGLLRLNIPIPGLLSGLSEATGGSLFNQETWDELYAAMVESGQELPNINEVVPTLFAQNAEVLEQIWSEFENGKYPLVTLNDSLVFNAYIEDLIPVLQSAYPGYTEERIRTIILSEVPKKTILGIPEAVLIGTSETEVARGLSFEIYSGIFDINDSISYNTGGKIFVALDDIPNVMPAGSMEFFIRPFTKLYFPQDGATLRSDQMMSNDYDIFNFIDSKSNDTPLLEYFIPHLVNAEGEATAQRAPFFITADFSNKKFKYFDGLSLKEAVIESGGSVTVTTLGSLTAPTE